MYTTQLRARTKIHLKNEIKLSDAVYHTYKATKLFFFFGSLPKGELLLL